MAFAKALIQQSLAIRTVILFSVLQGTISFPGRRANP